MIVPLSELREAVYARLVADIDGGAARVFTVAPEETPRPYVELDDLVVTLDGQKGQAVWNCLLTIRAHGDDPSATDVSSLLNQTLRSLDRADVTLSNDFVVDETWLHGPVIVAKFIDGLAFQWVGSMTMRFRVRDTRKY